MSSVAPRKIAHSRASSSPLLLGSSARSLRTRGWARRAAGEGGGAGGVAAEDGVGGGGPDLGRVADREAVCREFHQGIGVFHILAIPGGRAVEADGQRALPIEVRSEERRVGE